MTQREAAGLGDQKGFFEEVLEKGERELLRLLVVMLLRLGLEALLLQEPFRHARADSLQNVF